MGGSPIRPIQPSFASGEVSPEIYARVDINKYKTGLKTLHNMISHPTGGVSNRPGTRFVAEAKYSDKQCIVQEFIFSQTDRYVLEIGEEYVRFYTNGARIAITAVSLTDFDPSASYTAFTDYCKVGGYIDLDFGTSKNLYVASEYGTSVSGKSVSVATAGSDVMSVGYVAGAITINLADTTPAKNSADLIQVQLRAADVSLAAWTVTENAAYAAGRPTSATIADDDLTVHDELYFCIQAITGTATNTSFFPAVATTYWSEQSAYEVETPYQEEDLMDLRFETSADTIFITHADYQTRVLERYGATDWRLSLYEPEDGPFMAENSTTTTIAPSAVTGAAITLTASASAFDSDDVGALVRINHYIEGQTATSAFSATGSGSAITCYTTWRLITHGTWTGKIRVEKSSDSGATWTVLRSFSGADDFNVNTSGTEDIELNEEPFQVRVACTSYTSGTINVDLTTDPFFQQGIAKITDFSTGLSVTAEVLTAFGTTAATTAWAEGAWSDRHGWPAVSRFYQDRLVFAGTYDEPMTLWMSTTGNYFSFKRHTSLLSSDGITTNIPSRQLNAINGLVAFKRLLVFTSASVWSVGPVSGSGMTPTDFTQDVEAYNGSNGVNPAVLGNEAIYVQSHSKIVSNIGYDYASDSFAGTDLNILAKHLFEHFDILDVAFQRNPDRIIWMLRDDGKLIGMTYLKEQDVVAFHWHDTGQATEDEFESICVVPADGFDEVWFSVARENGRFIERMVLRNATQDCGGISEITPENQIFMDSCVDYIDGKEITTISVTYDGVFTITVVGHLFSNGDTVTLKNVTGATELTNTTWVIGNVTADTFDLITAVV